MNSRFVGVFFLVMMLVLGCGSAFGQAVAGGQIRGTITDPSGATIAGAPVTVQQTNSGYKRTVASGTDGAYVFLNLPVGPYTLQVAVQGFSNYTQSGIVIQVGDNLQVNVTLTVGAVTEQVQVSAGAPMVETESTAVSEVMDQSRIVDLPLNGRNATQLILISGAAASAPVGDMATTKNYPSSVTITIAGGQANGTNYLLDGGDNNDAFSNVNLPFPFPDALQEFSVQTTGLSARYGLHPGAVVNVVTQSGTNRFHGDLFEFLRNGDVNARNFFAATHDNLRRNQFGGTVGGPVRKDKLFFFFGYQGTRTATAPPDVINFVPTQQILNGDFSTFDAAACESSGKAKTLIDPSTSQPFPNNFIPPSRFNAVALNILKKVPIATNLCGQIIYGIPNPSSETQILGRVDYVLSQKHAIFGRYFIANYSNPLVYDNTNYLLAPRPILADQSQSVVVGDNYSFSPTLINVLHLTFTRLFVKRTDPSNFPSPPSLGVNMWVAVPNYTSVSVSGDFSVGGGVPFSAVDNSWQVADDLDWVRGRHHLSFGVDWIHNQMNDKGSNGENGMFTSNGVFTGDAMADFMLGAVSSFSQTNEPTGYYRQNYIGLYAQDDIRVSSRLSFHAGLRWEPFFPETMRQGGSFLRSAFDAGQKTPQFDLAPPGLFFVGDPGIPPGYAYRKMALFEPRIGFAWDPKGDGRQSIRASYNFAYDTPMTYYLNRDSYNPPWASGVSIASPVGGLSNPYLGYPGGNPFPVPNPLPKDHPFVTAGVYMVTPLNLHPTYMQQWNLSYQLQFHKDWALSITYLGNKTTHVWGSTELDPAVYIPGTCSGKACSSTSNTNQRRVLYLANPATGIYYSTIAYTDDGANANYNGVLATVRHRLAQNFMVVANYTYSHCLSTANFSGDLTGPGYQNVNDRQANYGNCNFDLRQNLNGSFLVHSPRFAGLWTNRLLGGWELAPLFMVHSGTPFTPVTGVDNSLTAVGLDRPNIVGNPYLRDVNSRHWLNASSFVANPIGTFGNVGAMSVYGPGYFGLDASLSRYFQIIENHRLSVRAEFFNALNHTNFSNPTASLASANFGIILASSDPRILQFSMKYTF